MSKLFRVPNGNLVRFWCPGCKETHQFNTTWAISGTDDAPTVNPSVLVTSGHYVSAHKSGDSCWCTYNKEHPDKPGPSCSRCHSFIRNGSIEFLGDCTHELKGKTVPMEEYREP